QNGAPKLNGLVQTVESIRIHDFLIKFFFDLLWIGCLLSRWASLCSRIDSGDLVQFENILLRTSGVKVECKDRVALYHTIRLGRSVITLGSGPHKLWNCRAGAAA